MGRHYFWLRVIFPVQLISHYENAYRCLWIVVPFVRRIPVKHWLVAEKIQFHRVGHGHRRFNMCFGCTNDDYEYWYWRNWHQHSFGPAVNDHRDSISNVIVCKKNDCEKCQEEN